MREGAGQVVFSHSIEALFDVLIERLFFHTSAFARKVVLVPSERMKQFLLMRMATDSRLQIAAGVQIFTLGPGILELFHLIGREPTGRVPSFLELSLHIQHVLMEQRQEELFAPVMRYLEREGGDFSERGYRRLCSLSEQISSAFLKIAHSEEAQVLAWLGKGGWESALFRKIFSKEGPWALEWQRLKEPFSAPFAVHVFGFDFLPLPHLRFLKEQIFYQFSPCQMYWEDLCSDRERFFLTARLSSQGEALDGYLKERHPLLANWGGLGKEYLRQLSALDLLSSEEYPSSSSKTLLEAIRDEILWNRPLSEVRGETPPEERRSVQVHSASSLLREVEVVKEKILEFLAADPGLEPRQIAVFAPDIHVYAPYIQMVFSALDLPFAYGIEGLSLEFQNPFAQGLHDLLALPADDFAVASVFKVFSHPLFLQRFCLSSEDLAEWKRWVNKAEIRRGRASWEKGFERLLAGLVCSVGEEEMEAYEVLPTCSISLTEAERLGQWISLFRSVYDDLQVYAEKRPLSEWIKALLALSEKYFSVSRKEEVLLQRLEALSAFPSPLAFESIEQVLSYLLSSPGGTVHGSLVQKVSFSSLRLGALLPAKVIWVLGMHEGSFPRQEKRAAVCTLEGVRAGPTVLEEDRYQFLQLLFLASDQICMSYVRLDPKDHKPQAASSLVLELLSYIDRRFGIASHDLTEVHPSLPFDKSYFSTSSTTHSRRDFLAAKAHSTGVKKVFPSFFPWPTVPQGDLGAQKIILKKLAGFARHPVRFYFHETLKFFMDEEEDREAREFVLSPLDKFRLRTESLKHSAPIALQAAEKKGILPSGIFQEIALQRVQKEVVELEKALSAFGVECSQLFSVELREDVLEMQQISPSCFLMPALCLSLSGRGHVEIVGRLDNVSPKGLLVHGEDSLEDIVKSWPQFLILHYLKQQEISTLPQLLLTKDGALKTFPDLNWQEALCAYLCYFALAHKIPSFLMPAWAEALLCKTPADLEKKIRGTLEGSVSYEDPYLKWLKMRGEELSSVQIFETWSAPLRAVFSPLLSG